jgi:WD40 repeat protein
MAKRPIAPPLPEDPQAIDPKKSHQVAEFKHGVALTTCRIDPTGQYVFAGAEDFNVYRWQIGGKPESKTVFKGHDSWVRCFDFSADGQWIYTAGYDDKIGFWRADGSTPNVEPERMIEAHKGWVRWLRVSPDGKSLASCGNDNLVKLWSLPDGKLIREFAGHQRYPYAVVFHPDGERLVSFDLMGIIKEWNIDSGKELRSMEAKFMWGFDQKFRADMGGARDMCFSDDGKTLAVAGLTEVTNAFAGVHKPMILLVDWEKYEHQHKFKDDGFKGMVWGVRFHKDGYIIGCGAPQSGNKGQVWFWKPGDKKAFHTVKLSHCARGLDLTPEHDQFAVAQFDGSVKVYKMGEKL